MLGLGMSWHEDKTGDFNLILRRSKKQKRGNWNALRRISLAAPNRLGRL